MDIGNMLDRVYLRLCCLPGRRALQERTGTCMGKPKCPVCVSTWGCCKPPVNTAITIAPGICAGISHTVFTAAVVRHSAFLFLCFRNTFQVCHYRSFIRMDHQEMHKNGADMGRNTPFILQRVRLGGFSE